MVRMWVAYETKKKRTGLNFLMPSFWERVFHRPGVDQVASTQLLVAKDTDHREKCCCERPICANEVGQVR